MPSESKNIEPARFPELDWSVAKREESIRALYDFAENTAQGSIGWYWKRAGKTGWKGRALRLVAIILTTLGGLIPLLLAAGVDLSWLSGSSGQNPQYGQWGYIFLALAAACVALDRFFGFSSSWIRFVTSATELQTGLTRFHLDWAQLNARRSGEPLEREHAEELLGRLAELLTFVRQKIESETQAWATEYRSSLTELETRIKAELERQSPGGVELTVTNGDQATGGAVVTLDGTAVQTIRGTQGSIRPIFPGQHELAVDGSIEGEPVRASKLFTIAPGEVVSISMTLQPAMS